VDASITSRRIPRETPELLKKALIPQQQPMYEQLKHPYHLVPWGVTKYFSDVLGVKDKIASWCEGFDCASTGVLYHQTQAFKDKKSREYHPPPDQQKNSATVS
jgi:hypothetical protein